jgi:hypothetical protein
MFYDKNFFVHIKIFLENFIFKNQILLFFVTQQGRMIAYLGIKWFSGAKNGGVFTLCERTS